jgi:UDP-glucose 4-epimerase
LRVLVTGGSGFIGSHVVDRLRARGHVPVIYDLRASPWHEPGSVDTVLGSITDREALERALHSCDAVAHLAAVADVNDVHASPEDAERVNARGTVAVLEAARRASVERIVYASTIWVYSDCDEEAVDEDTLLPAPSHLYTSTKLAGELYCKAYQELYGIDYTILRFGIPYGPRAREAAVIPAFVGKALRGEPLTLAGDGGQSRRFVYVEDLADGVALGLAEVAANRVYNLASDENVTIKQIAETVRDLVGEVEIVHTPARPGDFGGKIVCSRRASKELAWRASTPFAEGVRRYVEWRRDQEAQAVAREEAAAIPAGEPDAESKPRQILILSADIGEGHDLPMRRSRSSTGCPRWGRS